MKKTKIIIGIPELMTKKHTAFLLYKKQRKERIYKIIAWSFAGLFILELIGLQLFLKYIQSMI